jgi:phosphoribosylanthranilate isomerase
MTLVKICGITNWPDARLSVDCGARLLGFNFYPRSPRYIQPEAARRIVRKLPKGVDAVGVFVNEPLDVVKSIGYAAKLDFVQLHGEESPGIVQQLSDAYGVIKAFRVRPGFRVATLNRYTGAAAFLLDGFDRTLRGGTGNVADWTVARRAKKYGFVFLAGGLKPDNVAAAIRAVRPYAVDVASGVELGPRKKDPQKLRAFFEAVAESETVSG